MGTRESSTAWNEILSAFVQCRYKAYLKLAGQRGRPPDIARCLTKRAKRHRRVAIEAISSSFAPLQMFDGRTAFTPAQSKTTRLVTNVEASYEGRAVRGDALLLPSMPPAGAKKPQVDLFVCVAQEKVGKSDTTLAACIGLLMSRATGITIPTVTIVYGAAFRQKKLRTADSSHKAASTCAAALTLITEEQPPKLRLNRHCNACEFKKRCRAQAERDDDLSLMQAISEREIARLNAKGILTVTQYSYTYRRRRRRKGTEAKLGKHNLALQALAKRTGTIYVAHPPDVPPADTAVYLDLEGVPDRDFYYLLGMRIVANGSSRTYVFWADSEAEEQTLWQGFIRTVTPLSRYVIFHYGAYETRALRTLVSCV